MPFKKSFSFKKNAKESHSNIDYKTCTIQLLNENQPHLKINLKNDLLGSTLLDEVGLNIGKLLEKDYFGLRYHDKNDQKFWLKLNKPVIKQLKRAKTDILYFSVKYYPADPLVDLVQELACYQLYLQLRKDLYCECLIVNEEILQKLISLAIQAEAGDISPATPETVLNLINSLKIVKNVSSNTVKQVCEIVETLHGSESREIENQFIQIVSQLESYGVEPNCVLDKNGSKIFLAMNYQGICTFIGEKRTSIYYWENISKLMCISRHLMLEINVGNSKQKLDFKFSNEHAASAFWMWAIDWQYFMTLKTSTEAKKVKSNNTLFRRKIKYKFSGRSQKEVTESCQTLQSISQPPIIRTRNPVMLSRSNSAKAVYRDSMIVESDDTKPNTYATLPRRSTVNKTVSAIAIDFQENRNDGEVSITSSTNNESYISNECNRDDLLSDTELPEIEENEIIEVIEPVESLAAESTISKFYDDIQDFETDSDQIESKIRERHSNSIYLDNNNKENLVDGNGPDDLVSNCSNMDHDFHFQPTDGMFFVKFVVMTTIILLVIMVTSLVAYYYYRSASIADLKKQRYSTEWNKNIDLEAIKRFVLRNDAP